MDIKTKKNIIANVMTLLDCCNEALNGDWDKCDAGFFDMIRLLNEILDTIAKEKTL